MSTLAMRALRLGKVPLGLGLAALALLLLLRGSHTVLGWIALLAAGAAAWELSALLGRKAAHRATTALAVVGACLLSKALLSSSREAVNEFLLMGVLVWIIVAPLWLALGSRPAKPVLASLGCFAIVCAWLGFVVLAEYDRWMLIAGVAAVGLADTSAWLAGRTMGRVKLAPELSPNKTWEGVLGSLFSLYLLATVLWWAYLSDSYPHWLMLLVAAAVCCLSVLGDLVESALKRQSGVKDSGVLMGSHGGMLDRIDSWLPVLPFLGLLSTLTP